MRLGIISALHEEQQGLVEAMDGTATVHHGMRDYATGNLWGINAVCVLSRLGKVAAAMTATVLIERFRVTHVLFTGVAGSAAASVRVGDIVIAETLVQYDMDVRPLFPKFQVPLTGLSHFPSTLNLSDQLARAAQNFLHRDFTSVIKAEECAQFRMTQPKIHRGLIGSGDQFVTSKSVLKNLSDELPGLLAIEMEGAAVAQVSVEMGVPFAVIRAISDDANEDAATDFLHFVKLVAARYTFGIIKQFCVGTAEVSE